MAIRTDYEILFLALLQTILSPVVALRIWFELLPTILSVITVFRRFFAWGWDTQQIGNSVPYAVHILNLSSDLSLTFWGGYWYYKQQKNRLNCCLNDHNSILKEMAAENYFLPLRASIPCVHPWKSFTEIEGHLYMMMDSWRKFPGAHLEHHW